jgi:hypothetical protein
MESAMTVPPRYGPPGEPTGNDPANWPAQSPWQGASPPGQPQPAGEQQPAHNPQPGEWTQQPYGQQQYPSPQQYPPQQYPPQPYQPQAGPGWGWAHQQPPPPGAPWGAPPPAQPPKRHGKLIAATAAVIVLAGGGIATYVAVSDSDSGTGAASPKAAINSIVDDLNNSDLLGALDDLAPGERDALAQPVRDEIAELKRLKVLSSDADGGHVAGVTFRAHDLTFAKQTVKINDRVQIVNLTGGTLDIGADAAKFPFSREFLKAAFPHGMPAGNAQSQHVDIGQVIQQQRDGQPIRLSTQRVGDKWYPSIFYTVADQMSGHTVPAPSSAIPAKGASSPEQAVKREINALLRGDYRAAIELISPSELAALHDYGGMLLQSAGTAPSPDVTIQTLDLTSTKISDGVRVGLKKLVLRTSAGQQLSIAINGQCADVGTNGKTQHVCADQLVSTLLAFARQYTGTGSPPPETVQALSRVLTGLTKIGVDTSETAGQWYVNPVRSMLDVTNSVLSALQDNDIVNLIKFFTSLDR